MQRFASGLVIVTMLLGSAIALSNPLDTYGFTSEAIGMGGGVTASASSYAATYYNPAGMAQLSATEFGVGVLVMRPFLDIGDRASPANVTRALMDLGFATPVPLGRGLSDILFVGAAFSVPGERFYAIRARPWTEAQYPLYGERNDRLVVNLAMALKPFPFLSIGAGLSLLPQVAGKVAVDFTGSGEDASTSVDVRIQASPTVGLRVEPLDGLAFGITWRGANRTDISLPVDVTVSENIAPIAMQVVASDYSIPHEIALGAAWRNERWLVAADVTVLFYRQFRQSAPSVVLYDALGTVTRNVAAVDPGFADTVSVRGGAQWHLTPMWTLRAGGHFVQSPMPAQTGDTNLLDGHRVGGAVGAGIDLGAMGVPVAFDAHVAGSWLISNRDEKRSFIPSNPGYPSIGSHGWLLTAGVSGRVRFE